MSRPISLTIVTLGPELLWTQDHVLRREAAAIDYERWPRELLRDLGDAMYVAQKDARGAGLAAPQVGLSLRLVVVDHGDPDGDPATGPLVLGNPMIVASSEERQVGTEGCLSLPGYSGLVERPVWVRCRAQDPSGDCLEFDARGTEARILLHEIDHLDGVLYPDRMEDPGSLQPFAVEARPPRRLASRWRLTGLPH